MSINNFEAQVLACPVCRLPLPKTSPKEYRCPNQHTFDIARQGYVNLLLSTQQSSKELGDSREMLQRRRQFLDSGFYNPISERVSQLLEAELPSTAATTINILDAGCGEGFYVKRLKDTLLKSQPDRAFEFYGLDISKAGVQSAANRDKAITFAVASVGNLPILDGSLDFVVSFFAPVNFEEFSRVLKPGGKLITAKAGPHHLYTLRQLIASGPIEPLHDRASAKFENFFSLEHNGEISYDLALKSTPDLLNLLLMTPYSWNVSPQATARLEQLPGLQTQVEINLKVFNKSSFNFVSP